jgi:hypothetical protein
MGADASENMKLPFGYLSSGEGCVYMSVRFRSNSKTHQSPFSLVCHKLHYPAINLFKRQATILKIVYFITYMGAD